MLHDGVIVGIMDESAGDIKTGASGTFPTVKLHTTEKGPLPRGLTPAALQ